MKRLLIFAGLWLAAAPTEVVWKLDNLDQIGGFKVRVEGAPKVINTRAGKAIEFHGGKDALFLDAHPLAGAETFTWEVIFRPDSDGPAEQRVHPHRDRIGQRALLQFREKFTDEKP